MARTLRVLAAVVALLVCVIALAPKAVVRHKPATPAAVGMSGPGRLIVDLTDNDGRTNDADLLPLEAALGVDFTWTSADTLDEGLAQADVPDLAAALQALNGNPLVEVAEPELPMQAFSYPDDPLYDKQWHMKAMGAPVGWATTPRGKGIIVAVVDTGVTQVEDLAGTKVLAGASFVPGVKTAADDNGHGTHCAGTIAQTTNNGVGLTGVAPEATILPVKVLSGGGSGMSEWIAAGIDWAVDHDADVISLSLGGGYSAVIENAVKKAHQRGVIVVAAAGNGGREGVSYPGALVDAIGVSATGPDGSLAPYSSWGKGVDIAGPGGDKTKPGGGVWQDTVDGKGGHTYAEFQGTSMATPHVAGAAAVLLSTGMEPAAVERVLLDSASGTTSWDPKLGNGRLDLAAALGTAIDGYAWMRFALAGVLAALLTQASPAGAKFRAITVGTAAVAAGGLFFLNYLPIPMNTLVKLIASPVLLWPSTFISASWVNFPLWISAAVPLLVAFTFGAFRGSRPFAVGLCVGVGAHLVHAAAVGSLHPWWMSTAISHLWLIGNGVLCFVVALALVGTEKLDREGR